MAIRKDNDDVLVVRGVGEKRTAAQWAVLIGIPGVLVLVGVLLVLMLTNSKSGMQVQARTPQAQPDASQMAIPAAAPTADPAAAATGTTPPVAATTDPSAAPTTSPGTSSPAPATPGTGTAVWAGFRGTDRMGVSNESLARAFPASGPRRLWQAALGEGHAGAAVYKGRVYILDYNLSGRRDELRCLDLNSGKQLWSQGYAVDIKTNHGISRTIPATDGRYVVSLGPMGQVMCCEAASGKVLWKKDLVKEYGTVIPEWYAGQCPLIDGNKVIIAPGGKALMFAADLASGKVVWTTPNPKGWQMTHSSIMPVSFAGKKVYVYPATKGVVGVNAADGKELWETTQWTVNTSNIPMPVPIGNGAIFVSGGYNSGAAILQMGAGATSVSMTKRIPATTFQSHQQTPILYGGHLYGVKAPSGSLVCMDLTGRILWTSPNTARFGLGPYVIAGGILYVLSDQGELAVVEPSPSGYKELGRAKVLSGHDAWAPIAVADGKIIVRDLNTMVCLDMRP